MTYQSALAFLASKQFQPNRGRDYYQKIERVNRLFSYCGQPHKDLKVILVGGTVGKTSTCYYIARLVQSMGFKVGLHISPHLQSPRERMQINEKYISRIDFSKLLSEHQPLIQKINLSYAETLLALAIIYFRRQSVDWSVVEVGLGGLYDPTNSLDPQVSVITNIDNDHGELLGTTNLSKLREKVAICRPGRPLVTGIHQKILHQWLKKQALVSQLMINYVPRSDDYQVNDLNIALAVYNIVVTPPWSQNPNINLQIPGRLEWLTNRLLVDCAHNQPGLRALKKYLSTHRIDCELIVAQPGSDKKDSAKFVDHVMNRLKHSQQVICATGSILAVGALRNQWTPID